LVEAVQKIAVAFGIHNPPLVHDRERKTFDTSPEMWLEWLV
jgi:hypothetical protein